MYKITNIINIFSKKKKKILFSKRKLRVLVERKNL